MVAPRAVRTRIVWLVMLLVWLPALAVAETLPQQLQGIGLMTVKKTNAKGVKYPIFQDANAQSPSLGEIYMRDIPDPGWAAVVRVWEEHNPDAGWFGKKTRPMRSQTEMDGYGGQGDLVGLYVYAQEGVWLQTQLGWINSNDARQQRMEYVPWKDVIDHRDFPEFSLPDAKSMSTASHINELRQEAQYFPIGNLSVMTGTELDASEMIVAQSPLKLAIVAREGEWLNVVAVLDPCVAASGQTDYREGTRGWVRILSAEGRPNLFKGTGVCE